MSTLYARREPKAARLVGFDILLTAGDLRSEEDAGALFVFCLLTMQTHAWHSEFIYCRT